VKHDHGMRRCWLNGKTDDAVHAVLCAAGYNLRWLLRAVARLGLKAFFYALSIWLVADKFTKGQSRAPRRSFTLWAEAWPQTTLGCAQ
jgi:transposase, IS5 family